MLRLTDQTKDGFPCGGQLNEDNNAEAATVKGGLGEFSVFIDGQKVIETNRLWYPVPSKVIKKVRQLSAEWLFVNN